MQKLLKHKIPKLNFVLSYWKSIKNYQQGCEF